MQSFIAEVPMRFLLWSFWRALTSAGRNERLLAARQKFVSTYGKAAGVENNSW